MGRKRVSKLIILFIFAICFVPAFAQNNNLPNGDSSFEISFGPSFLFGNVDNPIRIDSLKNTTFAFGYHQELNSRLSYKIYIYVNNFEFSNKVDTLENPNILNITAQLEYSLFHRYEPFEHNLFIHTGLGYLYDNHSLKFNLLARPNASSEIYDAITLPIGLGYRIALNDRFKIGADLSAQYAFYKLPVPGNLHYRYEKWPHSLITNFSLTLLYTIYKGAQRPENCNCEWY